MLLGFLRRHVTRLKLVERQIPIRIVVNHLIEIAKAAQIQLCLGVITAMTGHAVSLYEGLYGSFKMSLQRSIRLQRSRSMCRKTSH